MVFFQPLVLSLTRIAPHTKSCSIFCSIQIHVGNKSATNYSDFSNYVLFSKYAGPYSADDGRLSCIRVDGVSGRFVAIMKVTPSDGSQLQLVDVNVLVRIE